MPTKRLLICTQKVDKDDPILGFFHEWITALAPQYAHITVVCLEKGNAVLPDNVTVRSLGKEVKKSRIQYIVLFYSAIFTIQYDAVFVHMNEEYVLLGGLYWRLLGKRVSLWRNHIQGSWKTRLAVFLSNQVFCTSPSSYTARFKKTALMPVGIDEKKFTKVKRNRTVLIYVGRISPVKNIEVMIDALRLLKMDEFSLHLYGPVHDSAYMQLLLSRAGALPCFFHGPVAPAALPDIYASAGLCINTTNAGSFDKTILEAAFCGCLPIASHDNFAKIVTPEVRPYITFISGSAQSLADTIARVHVLTDDVYETMAQTISLTAKAHHSLDVLISALVGKL